MGQEPAVEVSGLSRRFGRHEAVTDLTFCVAPGTIFGLLGPNGAGKTTTLRLLATLLEPTGGHAYLHGIDLLLQPRQARHRLGYMPDQHQVREGLTVREYLDLHAACHGLHRRERAPLLDDVLRLCDLEPLAAREVSTLSRGVRQRLVLARALAHDPQVLLLDEPASGLDPRARLELLELLRELASMGKTILVSSHILQELSGVCTAIAILEAGRLRACGTIAELTRQVTRGARFRVAVEVSGDQAAAARALERVSGVTEVRPDGDGLVVRFDGAREHLGQLTRALGDTPAVELLRFDPEEPSLEELFLSLTTGTVS
jgi:ABC-2 type transport system ATP-binding protein